MIRFAKKKSKKPAFVFIGLGVAGLIGNQILGNMTDGVAVDKLAFDKVTGKEALQIQHQKETTILKSNIETVTQERDRLLNEKVSRGEMERTQRLQKQKVIEAIANNLTGVFKGKARYIYAICKGYEVNPMLLAAIMKHETGNGTSPAVRNLKNPGGIMFDDSLKQFATLENGIEAMARLLKDFYIDQGRCDIPSIGAKYCPVGAKNDPKGLNRHWVPTVTENYNKILQEAQ